jgi:hypothetical protein
MRKYRLVYSKIQEATIRINGGLYLGNARGWTVRARVVHDGSHGVCGRYWQVKRSLDHDVVLCLCVNFFPGGFHSITGRPGFCPRKNLGAHRRQLAGLVGQRVKIVDG